jgi:hypothetical protein
MLARRRTMDTNEVSLPTIECFMSVKEFFDHILMNTLGKEYIRLDCKQSPCSFYTHNAWKAVEKNRKAFEQRMMAGKLTYSTLKQYIYNFSRDFYARVKEEQEKEKRKNMRNCKHRKYLNERDW